MHEASTFKKGTLCNILVDSHTEKLVVCSRKGYHTLKLALNIFVVDYKSVNYKSFLPQNFMVYMPYFQMKKTEYYKPILWEAELGKLLL